MKLLAALDGSRVTTDCLRQPNRPRAELLATTAWPRPSPCLPENWARATSRWSSLAKASAQTASVHNFSFLADVPSASQPHDVFGANRGLRGGCLILDRRRR